MAEYSAWANMIQRCYNPKASAFSRYGAVGIKVCRRWRHNFDTFVEDIGRRPSGRRPGRKRANFSLDRIDGSRGYEPGNVRWATAKQQAANKRCSVCGSTEHIKPICPVLQKQINDWRR